MNLKEVSTLLLLSAVVLAGFVISHEQAHVEINKVYGCSSHVTYGLFEATTVGLCPVNSSDPKDTIRMANYDLAQSNVEAFGYQMGALGLPIIVLLLYLIIRIESENHY